MIHKRDFVKNFARASRALTSLRALLVARLLFSSWKSLNKRKILQEDYRIHNHTLKLVDNAKYLGVTIATITSKATKTISFLQRNLTFTIILKPDSNAHVYTISQTGVIQKISFADVSIFWFLPTVKPAKNLISRLTILALFGDHSTNFSQVYTSKDVFLGMGQKKTG